MKNEILLNKLFRLPINKGIELYKKFVSEVEVDATTYSMHQQVSDIIGEKIALRDRIRDEVFDETRMYLAFIVSKNKAFADVAYEELKKYPMIIWIELIGALNQSEILTVLNSYAKDMPSMIVESLIMNLPETVQAAAIEKYKDRLDSKSEYFQSFYYCVGVEAQSKLQSIFNEGIEVQSIFYIRDLTEENFLSSLSKYKEKLSSTSMDEIVEQILLKSKDAKTIFSAMEVFSDRLQEISDLRFKILVRRTASLLEPEYDKEKSIFDDPDLSNKTPSAELEIFEKFKSRFYTLGLAQTLELLDIQVNSYDDNEICNEIIFNFLDIAYDDQSLANFINYKTLHVLIKRFQEKCQRQTYTQDDFANLVSKLKTAPPYKLIKDDYIEAMVACGQLMQKKLINNQDPNYIKLRNEFIKLLNNNVEKDGTYSEDINLNGLFYRLIKGTLDFDKVITTKTYKGLIYLTKCGECINCPDEITQFLSDEQVAKLDIRPLLRWRKEQVQKEIQQQTLSPDKNISSKTAFIERMGLQLLCYFDEIKAKYILDFDLARNRMENLFDNIDYKKIKIDKNGKPVVNEELLEFLFGRGSVSEKNTVINKILRGELLDFGKVLKELCNNYETIKKECHGVLTVKRIRNYFDNKDLPVKLKPNEYNFARALNEMHTSDINTIQKGIDLCHAARKRTFSSIPKVSGKVGDFTYEILDLKNPFALAVGYLSHCCFVVDGISHSALAHSMSSENGRTFVVYYKDKFLTQSWIWRNGDVICFDSVEAGGYAHGIYKDDLRVLDVYKKAASDILEYSQSNESEEQCTKVVTVGNSDYIFDKLEPVKGKVPRPLERDAYVYDSNKQWVLAGAMPDEPRYGAVIAKYVDPRGPVYTILDLSKAKNDEIDDALLQLQSIKYDATGNEEIEAVTNINQLFVGDDWYIKTTLSGEIDAEIASDDIRAVEECKRFAKILGIEVDETSSKDHEHIKDRDETVKQLKLTRLINK